MLKQLDRNPLLMLIARIMIALIYFKGSFGIFSGSVPADFAATKGIPEFLVWAAYILKFAGGLAIIVGFQTRLAALGLLIFTLATAFIFHYPGNTFFKEITMAGAMLLLMAVGPGKLSVDEMKK